MNTRETGKCQKCTNHKVSVIIPVYNAEKYLHRCIGSILNQTHQNWEAIMVNDGSTDSSLDILNTYAGKDVRFRVISKENYGASSARNAGLDALRTEYFCFVDADDSIHPDYLRKMLEAAIEHNCDLVITGINFKDRGGMLYLSGLQELIPSQYIKCTTGGPVAKLYRRNTLNTPKLRFYEDMHYAEDYVFTLTYALRVNQYYAVQEALYNYHYDNENSLDHRFAVRAMPFEQYLLCIDAPWRVFRELLSTGAKIPSPLFTKWVFSLYNELWSMYRLSRRFLTKDERKIHTAHFIVRHRDFVIHIPWHKRISAPQRHPHMYHAMKAMWGRVKFLKGIFKKSA